MYIEGGRRSTRNSELALRYSLRAHFVSLDLEPKAQ